MVARKQKRCKKGVQRIIYTYKDQVPACNKGNTIVVVASMQIIKEMLRHDKDRYHEAKKDQACCQPCQIIV